MTVCDRVEGVKFGQKSVTFFEWPQTVTIDRQSHWNYASNFARWSWARNHVHRQCLIMFWKMWNFVWDLRKTYKSVKVFNCNFVSETQVVMRQLTAGSVIAKQERIDPSRSGRSQRRFWSSLPYLTRISMLAVSGAAQLNTSQQTLTTSTTLYSHASSRYSRTTEHCYNWQWHPGRPNSLIMRLDRTYHAHWAIFQLIFLLIFTSRPRSHVGTAFTQWSKIGFSPRMGDTYLPR